MLRLEQLKDFQSSDYIDIIQTIRTLSLTRETFRNLRSSTSNDQPTFDQIFQRNILPFIDNIINNIKVRFEKDTLALLKCFKIFDMKNINDDTDYGEKELHIIKEHFSSDFNESIVYEWKTFRAYLLTQKKSGNTMTQREVCTRLCQDGLFKDIYPQLSLAAEIFLIAPISTATVERDFSTMNRILTKLQNRLTSEHLDQLMRISIEGVDILSKQTKDK